MGEDVTNNNQYRSQIPVYQQGGYPTIESEEETKRKKKRKRKKHFIRFIIFLLIIALLASTITVIKYIRYQNNDNGDFLVTHTEYSIDDLTEKERTADYDSDGISNEDELLSGLDPNTSDTDGDGLSDTDERNVYHTDPTKYSTSGDGYSDAYKVVNGMNVNAVYEFEPISCEDNDAITLIPKKEGDSEKFVYKENESVPNDLQDSCIESFTLYSFEGDIVYTIDNAGNYAVYSYQMFDTTPHRIECTYTDNTITFANVSNCAVFICSITDENMSDPTYQNDFSTITDFYINAPMLSSVFSGKPITIMYDESTLDIDDARASTYYSKGLEEYVMQDPELASGFEEYSFVQLPTFEIKGVSAAYINMIKLTCTDDPNADGFANLISCKYHQRSSLDQIMRGTYESFAEEEPPTQQNDPFVDISAMPEWDTNKASPYYADSGFDMTDDAFRFSNLSTAVSEGGLCAGFSELTASLYNKGVLNPSASEEFTDETFSYSLLDDAHDNILTGHLFDYIPQSEELKSYCDDISGSEKIDSSSVGKPDDEVVKALEFYFTELNTECVWKNLAVSTCLNNGIKIDTQFSSIEALRDQFNNGDIATICFLGDGGHAINAYKLEQSAYVDDLFYIRTYDNNFPYNTYVNEDHRVSVDGTIYVQRYYEKNVFGQERELFYFNYSPVEGRGDYGWSNTLDSDMSYLWFMDEEYNIF